MRGKKGWNLRTLSFLYWLGCCLLAEQAGQEIWRLFEYPCVPWGRDHLGRYEGTKVKQLFFVTPPLKRIFQTMVCVLLVQKITISPFERELESKSDNPSDFFTSSPPQSTSRKRTSQPQAIQGSLFFIQFFSIELHKNVLHVRLEYILTTNKIRGFNFLQSLCAKVICNVRKFNDTIYLVASVALWFT